MIELAQEFSGKVALVTGTRGIGRASAFRLARGGAAVLACATVLAACRRGVPAVRATHPCCGPGGRTDTSMTRIA